MDIMRYCIKSLSKHLLKLNLDYKDLHKGEDCYVFGNGDSLKYYNLEYNGINIGIHQICCLITINPYFLLNKGWFYSI